MAIYRYDLLFSTVNPLSVPSRDDEILPPAASPGDWLEVMWPCVRFRDRQAKQGEKLCSQINCYLSFEKRWHVLFVNVCACLTIVLFFFSGGCALSRGSSWTKVCLPLASKWPQPVSYYLCKNGLLFLYFEYLCSDMRILYLMESRNIPSLIWLLIILSWCLMK